MNIQQSRWTPRPTNLTSVSAQQWSNWISTCRNCVMTQLHSRCCLKSVPPPFSAEWSALISQRKKARSADSSASSGLVVAETIVSIATLNSAHGCTYRWACVLFEISLLLFFFDFLLKWRCGGTSSVLDYFSILQGSHGCDIKYSQDHQAKRVV